VRPAFGPGLAKTFNRRRSEMAHELYEIDGEYSMAYLEGTSPPWHGLGQTVPADSNLEIWAEKSHLNYNIWQAGMTYFRPDNGEIALVPNKRILLRDDNFSYLSTVSDKYHVVQPKEVLKFFSDLVKTADFELVTAGSLFNGQKYWAMAKINESFKLMGVDPIEGYLLLTTSCDGSLANTGMFTSTRVVCNNTLSFAIAAGESGSSEKYIKFPHTSEFDPAEMKEALGLSKDSFGNFINNTKKLAKVKISLKEAFEFFLTVYGATKKEDAEPAKTENEDLAEAADGVDLEKVPINNVIKLADLFENGEGQNLKSAKGTLWGAVNAVTEFYDHHAGNRTMDSRINSAFFGKGSRIKEVAFNNALKLAA